MKASDNCLAIIRQYEGFRAKPYLCPAGVWTIGYGSTRYADNRAVMPTDRAITQAQADAIMQATLVQYEDAVNRYAKVPLTQNAFDALVDFAYNAGAKNLLNSTLLRKLNLSDYAGAAIEFNKWVFANGSVLPGLVKRRAAEKALFEKLT